MGEIAEILGRGTDVELNGRIWHVRPLTFNDLCDLEERFGDIDAIDLTRAANQRFVLWMALRKSNGVSETQITEHEIGELLTLDDPKKVADFVEQVFEFSGLISRKDEKEAKPKNSRPPKELAAA